MAPATRQTLHGDTTAWLPAGATRVPWLLPVPATAGRYAGTTVAMFGRWNAVVEGRDLRDTGGRFDRYRVLLTFSRRTAIGVPSGDCLN